MSLYKGWACGCCASRWSVYKERQELVGPVGIQLGPTEEALTALLEFGLLYSSPEPCESC